MNQPVNSADIHKAIVQEQAAQDRKKMMLNGVLLLLLLAAPFMIYPVFLMKILCFALFAVAFNLLFGFTGLLSFGHAAFLATGGYTTGYLLSNYSGLSTEMGIIVVNQSGTNKEAVAEHALGMMLCVSKQMIQSDRALRRDRDWDRGGFTGREMRGKTVGIVGLGQIGTRTVLLLENPRTRPVIAKLASFGAAKLLVNWVRNCH